MVDANSTGVDLDDSLTNGTDVTQEAGIVSTILYNMTEVMVNSTRLTTLAPQQEETTHASTVLTTSATQRNFTDFVYNHTLATVAPDDKDFFHHLSTKDETLFVGLIILGFTIPILFISIFALVCIRRRREKKARRSERLLRNAQELAMDDYPPAMYRIQALRA